ncbi:MAG: hypothetical protein VXY45_06970, partial [Pseudomonadota bacterium]|nr:hypothetical protein [Pseudomonadota bacterium]
EGAQKGKKNKKSDWIKAPRDHFEGQHEKGQMCPAPDHQHQDCRMKSHANIFASMTGAKA